MSESIPPLPPNCYTHKTEPNRMISHQFIPCVYQCKVEQRLTEFLIQYLLNRNKMSNSHGQDGGN